MKPFLSGRAQITAPSLQSLAAANATGSDARAGTHKHGAGGNPISNQPSVECIRQGDKIVRIVVSCPCGEKIEIECLYPANG